MFKERRPRPVLVLFLLSLVLLGLFLVFPEPLAAEISMDPLWCQLFESVNLSSPSSLSRSFAFQTSHYFGYFDREAAFFHLEPRPAGLAISDRAYSSWTADQSGPKALMAADGSHIADLPATHLPFFAGNRLFSTPVDGLELHGYDDIGRPQWSYLMPAHVTAFASSPGLVVVGMVDGAIEAVDAMGRQQLRFSPGGSRLEAIFGVALAQDGRYIAMHSGIDPQRLVVLGRGEGGYRVISHRYLDSDYRRPVSVEILPMDPYVLYQANDGVGIHSLDGSFHAVLPAQLDSFSLLPAHHHSIYYIVARQGERHELISYLPPDRLLGRSRLPDGAEFVKAQGEYLYFACPDGLSRVRVGER